MILVDNKKQEIKESLLFWNPWWYGEKRDPGVLRPKYLRKIKKMLPLKEAIIIQGIRRSGKSTLMYQIIQTLLPDVEKENICYLNFDDNILHPYLEDSGFPDIIYETYREMKAPKGKIYLFLDEIQNLKNWSLWVKKILDRGLDVKFILTCSSSHLLKKEYSSLLTGRTLTLEVFPLSFKEFLLFREFEYSTTDKNGFENIKPISDELLTLKQPELNRFLTEYLKFGGFPEVVLQDSENSKTSLLKEYFTGIIARDVFMRHNLRNGKNMENTANYLLSNSSNLASVKRLSGKIGISVHTIQNYFTILNDVYMLFFIPAFSYSYGQQLRYSKKSYAVDSGLINAVSFRFSENIGRIFENVVFLHLRRKYDEIFYWKNKKGKEVDFVVKEGANVVSLIQVCQNVTQGAMKRECDVLLSAMENFALNNGTVITGSYSGELKTDTGTIIFIPLSNWLLMD